LIGHIVVPVRAEATTEVAAVGYLPCAPDRTTGQKATQESPFFLL